MRNKKLNINLKYAAAITLATLLFRPSYSQVKNTERFVYASGFCSTSYIIDSSGIFFREHGCEGSSEICMGTYNIKKDTITFNFQKMDSIPVVLRVEESSPLSDTSVKITIQTRYGHPFSFYDTDDVDAIDTSGKFYTRCSLDKNGSFILSNPKKYKTFRLNFLEYFFHKWVFVDIRPNNLKLVLPLPAMFYKYNFYNSHPVIVTPKVRSMFLKNGELSDIASYPGEKPYKKMEEIE